ncbi:hypothetical protein GGR51DRAFT_503362 [Nemania sp. FL0031]|nr:hypothetical protein GGR51DRAFT_503362 [Nemania sp. FL0031]
MGSQIVQSQWSLNETSDSVYSIVRGVLQAATSDNVQPLAIMACEQFGNTIAISQETRLRIERTVLPTPEPVAIRFLKAKVGFMKHDCAVQLGSNQAGLRFLALAAALLACIPSYQCARALSLMLESTTSDKRLLPTTRHLTDLMSSIASRCSRSGFSDIVFGYSSAIAGACRENGYQYDEQGHQIPDSEGISALVDACRSLQRVGDQELRSVIVETHECAAWVAAFAKWSLETPPSIYFADGEPMFFQPGSQLTIIVLRDITRHGITIKLTKTCMLESFQDLVVQCPNQQPPSYYVSARIYGSLLLGHEKHSVDAMLAALPLAITIVRNNPRRGGGFPQNLKNSQQFTATQPHVFPSLDTLFKTMSFIFGLDPDFPFTSLASAKSFLDLPQVEHYICITKDNNLRPRFGLERNLDQVRSNTSIPRWWLKSDDTSQLSSLSQHGLPGPIEMSVEPKDDNIEIFARDLAGICYSILWLSLLNSIEDLYLPAPHLPETHSLGSLYHKVLEILTSQPRSCPVYYDDISRDLRRLFPPRYSPYQKSPDFERGSNLAWSTQTHVFWYSILDDFAPRDTSVCSINSCCGRLMLERETYDLAEDDERTNIGLSGPSTTQRSLYFSARSFSVNLRTKWQLTPLGVSIIVVLGLVCRRQPEEMCGQVSPTQSISQLTNCVLVNCEHQMGSSIGELRPGMDYIFPDISSLPPPDQRILHMFPTGGVGELQMYCLGWVGLLKRRIATVVRQRACLSCCIAASERLNCEFLIL